MTYGIPMPGDVLATVTYDGLCPAGHDAAWTAKAIQQKETPPRTEVAVDCQECPS